MALVVLQVLHLVNMLLKGVIQLFQQLHLLAVVLVVVVIVTTIL